MPAPTADLEEKKRRAAESAARSPEPERTEAPRRSTGSDLDTLHAAIGNGAVEQFARSGATLLPGLPLLHAAAGNSAVLARFGYGPQAGAALAPADTDDVAEEVPRPELETAATPGQESQEPEAPQEGDAAPGVEWPAPATAAIGTEPPAEAGEGKTIATSAGVSSRGAEPAVPEPPASETAAPVPVEPAAAEPEVAQPEVEEAEEEKAAGEDTVGGLGGAPPGDEAAAWREQARDRIRRLRRPNIDRAATAIQAIPAGAARAMEVRRGGQAGLKESARKALPGTPKAEAPQTPPEPEPVPEAAAILEGVSTLRLVTLTLPALTPTAGGIVPVLGTAPIVDSAPPGQDPTLLQDARAAATPVSPTASDQKANALNRTPAAPDFEKGQGEAQGPPVIEDKGAPPMPQVPAAARTDMTKILARLKTTAATDAQAILDQGRTAYYNGALKEVFPQVGDEWLPDIARDLDQELDGIRDAAGIAAADLDAAVEDRRKELIEIGQEAHGATKKAAEQAQLSLTEISVQTLEIVGSVADAVDTFIDGKQAAAQGGLESVEVERRRDKLLARYGQRIAELSRQYERAGQIRMGQIAEQHKRYVDAYQRAEQIETQALTPKDATDASKLDVRLRAADIRAKSRERITQLTAEFRSIQTSAFSEAQSMRNRTLQAGRDAARAIRAWADEQLGRERSWLRKLIDEILDWVGQARAASEAWAAERNGETALAMAVDIEAMRRLEIYAAQGVDLAAVNEKSGLTADQVAMVRTFAEGPDAGDSIAAVAVAIRMRIAAQRQPDLLARIEKAVIDVEAKQWRIPDRIGRIQRAGFDAQDVASDVRDAMRGPGTEEDEIYAALAALTPVQAAAVRKCYADSYDGDDIQDDIESELSGSEEDRAIALLEGRQSAADAAALYYAMKGGLGLGTDEETIWKTLRSKSPTERAAIEEEYKKLSGGAALTTHLHNELGSHDKDRANALMEGNTAKADAIAIDQAMRGGLTGLGTDEGGIEAVYAEVRRDVAAENPKWSSAQIEAEVARRNDDIEAAYNAKYEGDFGEQQSALRAAYKAEMKGPQLDLVNALADNDEAKADAARIQIEVDSIVYASDSTINAVLETQYTRALEDVRRDNERELKRQLQDDIDAGTLTEDQIAARRRQIERQLEGMARVKAKERMDRLNNTYHNNYNTDLKTALDKSTSAAGTTFDADKHGYVRHKKSLDLLEKGYLTPEEQIYYAVEGAGTDEQAITDALKGRTKSEIETIRKAWNRRFGYGNDNSFDNRILGEVSGREDWDLRDMLDYGEPENARERKDQIERRYKYETTAYGPSVQVDPLMRWMVSDDFKLMERRHQEALDSYAKWEQEKDPKKREAMQRTFDLDAGYMNRSAESVRKSVDTLADTMSQIAGTVAAIVVGAVVIIASWGTLTPAVFAAAAAWGSAAAALAAISMKASIKGSAYGYETLGVDVAVGIVDTVTAYFTANLGDKFIKFAQRLAPTLLKSLARGGPAVRWLGRGVAEGAENMVAATPSVVTATALDDENWKGDPVKNIVNRSLISIGYAGATSVAASQGLSLLGGARRLAGRRLSKGLVPLEGAGDPGVGATRAKPPDVLAARGTPIERQAAWREFRKANPAAKYEDFLTQLDAAAIAKRADAEAARQQQREMRREFLADLPPAERRALAGLPIDRVDDAAFDKLTSGSKESSAVVVVDGRARVILREGADASALRAEGARLARRMQAHLVAPGDAIEQLRAGLGKDLADTPLEVDPEFKDNTVRVEYTLKNGLPTDIRIVAGLGARAIDIALHQGTVRRMQSYSGIAGRVRMLLERIQAFITRHGVPPVGSRAWEAKLELEKLPKVIEERLQQLQGGLDPAMRLIVDDEIRMLRDQMDFYRDALVVFEKEPGLGYVAAQKRAGIPSNYPDLPKGWHYHRNPNGDINVQRDPGSKQKPGKKARLTKQGRKLEVDFVPDERVSWPERKENAAQRGHRKTVSPELDAELQHRRAKHNWNEDDAGQVREWGTVIDRYLAGLPANQRQAFLRTLLDNVGEDFSEAAFRKFRQAVREAVAEQIAATQPGTKQMALLREFLDAAPDSGTKGAIFTEYRRKRTEAKTLHPRIDRIDDAGYGLPNNRNADGAIAIKGAVKDGPPVGRYLLDDKAGDKAFKIEQALDYDKLVTRGKLQTGKGSYDGIVLIFENYAAAEDAARILNSKKVGKKIFVAYFGDNSEFKWYPR
jgi:hypothetical protein